MENEQLLEQIFLDVASVDFKKFDELKNLNLLGSQLNIMPIYLVLVLLNIERMLNIHFKEEDIRNGKFNTFNNIMTLINRECE